MSIFDNQPTPTPKRPNEEDSGDSDDDGAKASKMRRMARSKSDHRMLLPLSTTLPKEPTITDKEREDILRFVETEATEVTYLYDNHNTLLSVCLILLNRILINSLPS